PRTVAELERLGVRFDADRAGNLALGLEGGHSRRRVVHAGGSATGRRVVRELSALVVEHQEVTVVEGARATRLWTAAGRCVGDEVALAIWNVMTETGTRSVALDMRAIDPGLFPNVVGALREAGLDPATELIPVAPAAHYGMGGVVADLDGATTIPGLYAVGESACTGLHGANRLASNSLSECFVFGARAARAALSEPAGSAVDPAAAPPRPAGAPAT